ncbi:MAG: HdeD family acid-resistance protein [Pyrinomonadaceae bacterium]
MKEQESSNPLKDLVGLSIGVSVIMIILGCLAIVMPNATGIGISVIFGWVIILAGFMHFAYAFAASGAGSFLWRMLISLLYIVGGSYLLLNAPLTLAALTMAVAVIFILEGIFQIIAFFQVKDLPGAGWLVFNGIVSIVLGGMIAYQWPASSNWAIGTLIGVNLLFSGVTRLIYSVAAKNAIGAAVH